MKEKKTADMKAYQREYMKKWRAKAENKKKHNAYSREYYRQRKDDEAFKKAQRDVHRKWAKENPDKIKEYAKRAYQKSKKRIVEKLDTKSTGNIDNKESDLCRSTNTV